MTGGRTSYPSPRPRSERSHRPPAPPTLASTPAAAPSVRTVPALRRPGRLGGAAVILAPGVLMLALGLWGIRRENSMWRDESTTSQVAHRDLGEIWHLLGTIDAVHGAYYLLMHGVFALWDGGLLAMRLPSLLAMAFTAVMVGLTGRRLAGPHAGLLAGLILPLLPAVQTYAQEGRSYALVCAAVAGATHLLVRAAARPSGWIWAGYATALAVGCLLHEFAVLVLLAHGATLLWAGADGAVRWAWCRAAAAVVLVLMPLVIVSQQQAAQVAWLKTPGTAQLGGVLALVLAGATCAAVPERPLARLGLRQLALPLLAVPPAVLLLVSFVHPLYHDRYILYCHIGFALLIGMAADRLLRTVPRPKAMAAVVALATVAALLPSWLALRTRGSTRTTPTRCRRRWVPCPGPATVCSSCPRSGASPG
ncbi:glycosyltransferase family 39 protein [Streptomyces coffeae]|uniref:glycosyltransferase family 39 protein n=1 Tax=Streptomyces coffeae TaxID=621382 RepID=UPI001F23BBA6|nr:glycosyltransferase family 39 protein [Streptomyces coffeae]